MRNNRCKNLLDKQIEEVLLDLAKEVETLLSPVSKSWNQCKKSVKKYTSKNTRKMSSQKTIKEYWK